MNAQKEIQFYLDRGHTLDDLKKAFCDGEWLLSEGYTDQAQVEEIYDAICVKLAASAMGKKGGRSTSPAKKSASAANLDAARAAGKTGGYPRGRERGKIYNIITVYGDDGAEEIFSAKDFGRKKGMTKTSWVKVIRAKFGGRVSIAYGDEDVPVEEIPFIG